MNNTKAETIKMCDMEIAVAAQVLEMLNDGVQVEKDSRNSRKIVTDREPKDLIYPEGWYYAKGCFRNKHKSTTGLYEEIPMVKPDGERWKNTAAYCTLY